MASVTIYCVQSYWKDRRRLNTGDLRQFKDEAKARSHGERASRRQDGVLVYSLSGDPELDWWGKPTVLASYGETPLSGEAVV